MVETRVRTGHRRVRVVLAGFLFDVQRWLLLSLEILMMMVLLLKMMGLLQVLLMVLLLLYRTGHRLIDAILDGFVFDVQRLSLELLLLLE